MVPVERRAKLELSKRKKEIQDIDNAQHPEVQPPPLASRVRQLGEVVVAVVGGFCEFNDVVHDFVERAAREVVARVGGERGKVRRRMRRGLAKGAWKDWHRAIVAE